MTKGNCRLGYTITVLSLLAFSLRARSKQTRKNIYGSAVDGNFSQFLNPAQYEISSSLVYSSIRCSEIPDCRSFLFNDQTKRLQTFNSIHIHVSGTFQINMMGWMYYIMPPFCKPLWEPFADSCYLVSTAVGDWENGKNYCESKGAYLVEINNIEEDAFLRNILYAKGCVNGKCDAWIGGKDMTGSDDFEWVKSGTSFSFTNWNPGEPGGGLCALMHRPFNLRWIGTSCSNTNIHICEMERSETTRV